MQDLTNPSSLMGASAVGEHLNRSRAKGNTTGRKARYLLSGLLLCNECGQHYVHLKDLRGTLDHDTERARNLLAKLVGHITLRRNGDRVVAEMRGNLPGLLEIDERLDNSGAGRGIRELVPWRPSPFLATP